MSDFQKAFLALKRKADAGDPKAKAELAKLLASPKFKMALQQMAAAKNAASTALAIVQAQATDIAAQEAAEDIVGAEQETEELIAGDDLEAADHVAQFLPPGSDSLDHKAALRKQKWSNLNRIAPFASTNPPSVLQGTLGGQQQVSGTDLIEVANFQGDDAETTDVTVTLAPVQQITQDFVNEAFRPYAVVQFGTRGFSVKAFVDIGRGCQFTLSGSSVIVQVGNEVGNAAGTAEYATAGTMKLAGMLSFKPCVRTAPITRTVYVGALTAPDAARISIPPFAKRVWVQRAPFAAPINFWTEDQNGVLLNEVDLIAGQQMFDPMPLSDDAITIQFQTNGASFARVRFIFELCL